MPKKLEARIFREGIADTRTYRYHLIMRAGYPFAIVRIKLSDLDSTAAIKEWETVKMYD